jgi:hypothetical protein
LFKSRIRNPRKDVVWESAESFDTADEAAVAAFAARQKANIVRIVDCDTGIEDPVPCHRMYLIRRVAIRDGIESLPENLREEADCYVNPGRIVVGEATTRLAIRILGLAGFVSFVAG